MGSLISLTPDISYFIQQVVLFLSLFTLSACVIGHFLYTVFLPLWAQVIPLSADCSSQTISLTCVNAHAQLVSAAFIPSVLFVPNPDDPGQNFQLFQFFFLPQAAACATSLTRARTQKERERERTSLIFMRPSSQLQKLSAGTLEYFSPEAGCCRTQCHSSLGSIPGEAPGPLTKQCGGRAAFFAHGFYCF